VAGALESIEETQGGGGMRVGAVACWLAFVPAFAGAQSVRSLVNDGNDQYEERHFADAEVSYRKALERDHKALPGHFNLGNALYKQDKQDEAIKEYENVVLTAQENDLKAKALYNMGNTHMKSTRYQDAVKSYVESLKLDPFDQDAKYNLSYALAKLKEQQQQQNNERNKNDDQTKNDQQKQDQKDKQESQQNQQQQQQRDDQQQKLQERKMAKAEAERILDALKNNEKEVQKKLRTRKSTRAKTEKDW
jgi:tetratricopeptide (TPR) repeat protein